MANEHLRSLHDVCKIEELQHLLRAGANINERNTFEETPLLSALRRDVDFKLIKEFLRSGADVHAKDCWGVYPLYCAVARHGRNLRLIKLLLDHGADIESGKRINDRFLDHTVTHNQTCTQLIIKYKFLKNIHLLEDTHLKTDSDLNRDYYKEYKAVVDLDIKPSCYGFMGKFLDDYASEALRMQTVYVGDDLTLLRFANMNSNADIYGDPTVKATMEKVLEELSRNDYPVFKDIILSKVGRECLLYMITEQLSKQSTITEAFPIRDVLYCISRYLTETHLLDIVKALY